MKWNVGGERLVARSHSAQFPRRVNTLYTMASVLWQRASSRQCGVISGLNINVGVLGRVHRRLVASSRRVDSHAANSFDLQPEPAADAVQVGPSAMQVAINNASTEPQPTLLAAPTETAGLLPAPDTPILLPAPSDSGSGGGSGSLGPTGEETYEMSAEEIKAALLDSLYGTERGLTARSEVRAEINELISQLEAKNPTPNPTETLEKLDGNWKLVYTSNSEVMAVLALSRLPLVTVGDLTQFIDVASNTVENKVQLSGPLSSTSFSTTASFEVRSPKRLQFKLERGTISTPTLTNGIELPSSITVLGQPVDLTQLNALVKPVNDSLSGLLAQAGSLISQQPDISIPLQSDRAETWQLNTYVDDDMRIMRGDGGSVFIAVKEMPTTYYSPRAL